MSKPDVGVFLVSVIYNSNTWNATNGGIQSIDMDYGGEPLEHYAGDDVYPRYQALVRKRLEVNVGVDYISPATAQGVVSSVVFVIRMADNSTKMITCSNMKLVRLTHNQSEGVAGGIRLRLVHESLDGQTNPVSVM
jgi:hypothetical protein